MGQPTTTWRELLPERSRCKVVSFPDAQPERPRQVRAGPQSNANGAGNRSSGLLEYLASGFPSGSSRNSSCSFCISSDRRRLRPHDTKRERIREEPSQLGLTQQGYLGGAINGRSLRLLSLAWLISHHRTSGLWIFCFCCPSTPPFLFPASAKTYSPCPWSNATRRILKQFSLRGETGYAPLCRSLSALFGLNFGPGKESRTLVRRTDPARASSNLASQFNLSPRLCLEPSSELPDRHRRRGLGLRIVSTTPVLY